MKPERWRQVDEHARLFEVNLEPVFEVVVAGCGAHVMEKLCRSLKKALLARAIERYGRNHLLIGGALGLTRRELVKELRRCGLRPGGDAPA